MPKMDLDSFRVPEDSKDFDLGSFPTKLRHYCSKKECGIELEEEKERMAKFQEKLAASHDQALLIVFQGIDASGKDGVIKHVMSGLNPQGVKVTSFKRPNDEELRHGILWRHDKALPDGGEIGIWNRSHYEEVIIVRVHPEHLKARAIEPHEFDSPFWQERLGQIRRWEDLQTERGNVRIVKFFLNVSKEEQARRLLDRIEDKTKNYKFEAQDMEERKSWDKYMAAFEDALRATSTEQAPWYVIPADNKNAARLLISRIINSHLEDMRLKFSKPKTDPEMLEEFAAELRKELNILPPDELRAAA